MNVDCTYDEKTQGSGLDPLLIQIYIPTREYIPTVHSAHVTIQMLELHSKINIFTQEKKKGINNLWEKKSLQSQSSYYSALILSLHCTPVRNRPLPIPASMTFSCGCLRLPDASAS